METKCTLAVTSSRRIAEKYWPDMQHSETVTKFSLELFDALQKLHQLGARERCWLECAAVLHDVGLSQGTKAHHKSTLKLILNDTQFPFTSTERQVIGNIARYHRKGCPKNSNYNFMSLSRELRRKVTMLASILRLADALDSSHGSIVQNVEVQVNFDNVTILGLVVVNPILEEQDFNKKKDLFEKTFAEKMVLKWKYQLKTVDNLVSNSESTAPKFLWTSPSP
jgi:exopolyphosphatase/pppGpp-phosphohydrolase